MAAEGMQAHLMAQQGALAAELTELTAMQEAREKEAQAELESLKTQLRGAQEEGTERVSAVEAELAEVRATCAAARQEETRGRAMIDKLELENAEGLQRLRQKEEQLSGAQGQVLLLLLVVATSLTLSFLPWMTMSCDRRCSHPPYRSFPVPLAETLSLPMLLPPFSPARPPFESCIHTNPQTGRAAWS